MNRRKKGGVTWKSVSPSIDLVTVLQHDLASWSLPCIEDTELPLIIQNRIEELLQSRNKVL